MTVLLQLVVVLAFLAGGGAIAVLFAANDKLRRELQKQRNKTRAALDELARANDVAVMKEMPLEDVEKHLVDAGLLRRDGVFDRRGS